MAKKKIAKGINGYTPDARTTRIYRVKKGRNVENDIVSSDQVNWIGHHLVKKLAQNGVKISEHITQKGKMTPSLKKILNSVLPTGNKNTLDRRGDGGSRTRKGQEKKPKRF